ncbi:MAG: hypothetical protein ACKO0M_15410 [Cyanobium sp.]
MTPSRQPIQDFLSFLIGAVLLTLGVFLFFQQVMVGSAGVGWLGHGGARPWRGGVFGGWGGGWGPQAMPMLLAPGGVGLLLIPLSLGVALLFSERHVRWGWFLVAASLAALGAGILQTLFVQFQPTTLWNLLMMFALMGSGAGLMFRALRGYGDGNP